MRLKDKTAIVTGAGSGFGKGIAMRFAKEGARVGVIDINAEAAREVASQIGHSAFAILRLILTFSLDILSLSGAA